MCGRPLFASPVTNNEVKFCVHNISNEIQSNYNLFIINHSYLSVSLLCQMNQQNPGFNLYKQHHQEQLCEKTDTVYN